MSDQKNRKLEPECASMHGQTTVWLVQSHVWVATQRSFTTFTSANGTLSQSNCGTIEAMRRVPLEHKHPRTEPGAREYYILIAYTAWQWWTEESTMSCYHIVATIIHLVIDCNWGPGGCVLVRSTWLEERADKSIESWQNGLWCLWIRNRGADGGINARHVGLLHYFAHTPLVNSPVAITTFSLSSPLLLFSSSILSFTPFSYPYRFCRLSTTKYQNISLDNFRAHSVNNVHAACGYCCCCCWVSSCTGCYYCH